ARRAVHRAHGSWRAPSRTAPYARPAKHPALRFRVALLVSIFGSYQPPTGSFNQGGRWKMLIKRYIAVMPSTGSIVAPAAQSASGGASAVAINPIRAKVGAAARRSQRAGSVVLPAIMIIVMLPSVSGGSET